MTQKQLVDQLADLHSIESKNTKSESRSDKSIQEKLQVVEIGQRLHA